MLDFVLSIDCPLRCVENGFGRCRFGGRETLCCGNVVVTGPRGVMAGSGYDLRFTWEVGIARVWSLIWCQE